MSNKQRQLAAILFTDIVGYTAMMQQNEQHAVAIMKRYVGVLTQFVPSYGGKILNDFGDGSLCTFTSITEAMHCAIEIQQQLQLELCVPLRIGLHIGEIFFENEKVMGDGVNIASRIQSLAQANTILFSKEIFDKIRNQSEFKPVSLGLFEFKNVDGPMEVFALANDGLIVPKKKEMSGKLKDIQRKSAIKKWIIAAAAISLIIVSYFTYQHFYNTPGFSGEKTIAVLPFENIGKENNEEYISDGITQDIINSLSKIASLKKVVGWFSVKGFRQTAKPMNVIAYELGVAAILKGTLQKLGEKTRIVVELIEVGSQKRLWGDDYEYDNKNLLSIQSKIAGQIVDALKASVTPEEKKGLSKNYTENVEAYKYYRKGRSFWDKRTVESFDSAEVNYKRAIDLDPDYALAYSGLADLYIYNLKRLSQLEAVPIARDYATKALLLDSTLSEPLTTLGFIQSAFDYDWVKSKGTLKKAIALNPNYPTAHLFYGNLLQYTGENTEEGIKEIKKALALDPLSSNLNYVLGRNYYYANKNDSAYAQLKKTLALNPTNNLAKGNLAYVLLAEKKYAEAFKVINQLDTSETSKILYCPRTILSYAYAISGDKIRAKTELGKSIIETPNQPSFFLAEVYISLNEYNNALNRLEHAYNMRELWMYTLKADPTFDPIRNEPRFKVLMKKMRLD